MHRRVQDPSLSVDRTLLIFHRQARASVAAIKDEVRIVHAAVHAPVTISDWIIAS